MKMAIVTGAARGIGLATVRLFVDQGYQVAMVDRDKDALDAAAASLAGGTAFVCDVSDPAAVDEMGEFGIRVDCVAPGPVRTKLAIAVHSQAIIDAYHDAIPLNRYGSEAEIAEAVVFLGSEKSSYITGQILAVDGGFNSTGVGLPALRV